jgi:uncharacterized protein (TIGR04255 family)
VRFPLLFRFNERAFLASFQEAIQAEYPRVGQEQQVAFKVTGKGVEPSGEALWRFSDRDGSWSAVLGEGGLTLESRRYTSIDDFESRFEKLLAAAAEHLGVEERMRLGVRFINEMRFPGAAKLSDWAELLNPKFIGFGGGVEFLDGVVDRSFSEIQSVRGDGTLVIRHGLLNGSTQEVRAEHAGEQGPFYLLDLDYFDGREQTLDLSKTITQLRAYNEAIYQFFRWALDRGKLYAALEPV